MEDTSLNQPVPAFVTNANMDTLRNTLIRVHGVESGLLRMREMVKNSLLRREILTAVRKVLDNYLAVD